MIYDIIRMSLIGLKLVSVLFDFLVFVSLFIEFFDGEPASTFLTLLSSFYLIIVFH